MSGTETIEAINSVCHCTRLFGLAFSDICKLALTLVYMLGIFTLLTFRVFLFLRGGKKFFEGRDQMYEIGLTEFHVEIEERNYSTMRIATLFRIHFIVYFLCHKNIENIFLENF